LGGFGGLALGARTASLFVAALGNGFGLHALGCLDALATTAVAAFTALLVAAALALLFAAASTAAFAALAVATAAAITALAAFTPATAFAALAAFRTTSGGRSGSGGEHGSGLRRFGRRATEQALDPCEEAAACRLHGWRHRHGRCSRHRRGLDDRL